MSLFRRSPPPINETVIKSIRSLKKQYNKLEHTRFRLKQRDQHIYTICIRALKKNNKGRAVICANEISEIRKIVKILYNVELAIERVILRLETIKELSDIIVDLKPALNLLQNVSQQLFAVLPDVSTELNKVNEAISETLYSTRITANESIIPVNVKTPGGEAILKEVSNYLEEKISEELPEPPTTLETGKTPLKRLVALTASASPISINEPVEDDPFKQFRSMKTPVSEDAIKTSEIEEISLQVEESEVTHIEEVLLEYVKKSDGKIDIDRCSIDLNSSSEKIVEALERLGTKGKIKVELKKRMRK
jgi:division protein CdvB (Snf7/Vps24/ESCRT-III family)